MASSRGQRRVTSEVRFMRAARGAFTCTAPCAGPEGDAVAAVFPPSAYARPDTRVA